MNLKEFKSPAALIKRVFVLRGTPVSSGLMAILLLSLLAIGCSYLNKPASNQGAAPAKETSESPASEPVEETAAGPCANPYYPIDPAVKRRYKSSSSAAKDLEITLSQTAPEGDSFSETRTLSSGITVKTPWKCTSDGIRIAEYQNVIQSSKTNFQMDTLESSGVTLPAKWNVGEEWGSNYKVRVKLNAGPVKANADGIVAIKDKLVSDSENVSVPGGDYEAAKVETLINITIRYSGREVPSPEIKMTRWYSPKVGLVKQETKGMYGNTTMEYLGPAN